MRSDVANTNCLHTCRQSRGPGMRFQISTNSHTRSPQSFTSLPLHTSSLSPSLQVALALRSDVANTNFLHTCRQSRGPGWRFQISTISHTRSKQSFTSLPLHTSSLSPSLQVAFRSDVANTNCLHTSSEARPAAAPTLSPSPVRVPTRSG